MRYEQWHLGNGALNKILERLDPQLQPESTKKEFKRISNIKIQCLIFESLCSLHYDDSLEFVIKVIFLMFLLQKFLYSIQILYLPSSIMFVVF